MKESDMSDKNLAEINLSEVEEILKRPFDIKDIEWRVKQAWARDGKIEIMVLAYITARAAQARMDEAFGFTNWNVYFPDGGSRTPGDPVRCRVEVKINDQIIVREDIGEATEMEPAKGGASDAFKRVVVSLGIGQYLYRLPRMTVSPENGGMYSGYVKVVNEKKWVSWNPPKLPSWALPDQISEGQKTELKRYLSSHTIPTVLKNKIKLILDEGDRDRASSAIDACKRFEGAVRKYEREKMFPQIFALVEKTGKKPTVKEIEEKIREMMKDGNFVNLISPAAWLSWETAGQELIEITDSNDQNNQNG
jgi:hypothetical protein